MSDYQQARPTLILNHPKSHLPVATQGTTVELLFYNGKVISVDVPQFMDLKVSGRRAPGAESPHEKGYPVYLSTLCHEHVTHGVASSTSCRGHGGHVIGVIVRPYLMAMHARRILPL